MKKLFLTLALLAASTSAFSRSNDYTCDDFADLDNLVEIASGVEPSDRAYSASTGQKGMGGLYYLGSVSQDGDELVLDYFVHKQFLNTKPGARMTVRIYLEDIEKIKNHKSFRANLFFKNDGFYRTSTVTEAFCHPTIYLDLGTWKP